MTSYEIRQGDSLESLKKMGTGSVHCCITSPPYWGLRDYGTGNWQGGDEGCSHKRDSKQSELTQTGHRNLEGAVGDGIYKQICKRCGAKRVDLQIGLEPTPQEYVQKIVGIFREVRRVLRDDGTLWLNLGDTYSSARDSKSIPDTLRNGDEGTAVGFAANRNPANLATAGLKHKDLVGVPWRVALALQEDGWYLRQDIIWHKPNPMPESVTDRCTKAHEYIFLLSKSPNYYFDYEAIKENGVIPAGTKAAKGSAERQGLKGVNARPPEYKVYDGKRNKRSVWTITTKPYKEAHFATFPRDLIEPCVLAGCPKDGTILDPFGGSGTTAEVALENGRNAVLIELNPEYIKIAETRIRNTQANLF